MSLACGLVCACGPRSASVEPEAAGASGPIVEPASTTTPPKASPTDALEPEAAWLAVFAALRDGDPDAFARFAGAEVIRVRRETSVGETPPEWVEVAPAQVQTWLGELAATWAPACAERPDPPCRGLNPLSLGVEPDQLELRCTETEAGLCCAHDPPLLHNTPFLIEICFDDAQRVTALSILDG